MGKCQFNFFRIKSSKADSSTPRDTFRTFRKINRFLSPNKMKNMMLKMTQNAIKTCKSETDPHPPTV